MFLDRRKQIKISEVANIIKLYVAAGIITGLEPINMTATAIAKVPFCRPHSIDIAIFCLVLVDRADATK